MKPILRTLLVLLPLSFAGCVTTATMFVEAGVHGHPASDSPYTLGMSDAQTDVKARAEVSATKDWNADRPGRIARQGVVKR